MMSKSNPAASMYFQKPRDPSGPNGLDESVAEGAVVCVGEEPPITEGEPLSVGFADSDPFGVAVGEGDPSGEGVDVCVTCGVGPLVGVGVGVGPAECCTAMTAGALRALNL